VDVPPDGFWFTSRAILQPLDGSGIEIPALGDKSLGGEIAPSYGFAGPVPVAIVAQPQPADGPRPIGFGLWGDSVAEGQNDAARPNESRHFGWMARAAAGLGAGYTQLSKSGHAVLQELAPDVMDRKLAMLVGCTHIITNFGSNDFGAKQQSFAQASRNITTFVARLRERGHAITLCTILPRTDAANSGRLYPGGDTPATIEHLMAFNAWLRTDPLRTGVFDATAIAAAPEDPRRWRSDLGRPTDDGVHPKPPIHEALAAAFVSYARARILVSTSESTIV
jgi:lysophospholipase L1-like esterase